VTPPCRCHLPCTLLDFLGGVTPVPFFSPAFLSNLPDFSKTHRAPNPKCLPYDLRPALHKSVCFFIRDRSQSCRCPAFTVHRVPFLLQAFPAPALIHVFCVLELQSPWKLLFFLISVSSVCAVFSNPALFPPSVPHFNIPASVRPHGCVTNPKLYPTSSKPSAGGSFSFVLFKRCVIRSVVPRSKPRLPRLRVS